MNVKPYYKTAFLMTLIVMPIVASLLIFFMAFIIPVFIIPFSWVRYLRRVEYNSGLPEQLSLVMLPVFVAFFYYILVWIVIFGVAGFSYAYMANDILFYLTIPFISYSFFISLFWMWEGYPIIFGAMYFMLFLATLYEFKKMGRVLRFDKIFLGCFVLSVAFIGISMYQFHARSLRFLDANHRVHRVSHEVDVWRYRPFSEHSRLAEMPWEPTLTFADDFPRLDGATAAYPVFAAVAQALFVGLDADTFGDYVSVSGTEVAYQRLIAGEIDIFFGAQPSAQQVEAAQARGLEFIKTPVAKDAFVFFVHHQNPVDNLSIVAIRDIYQRRVTNWWELDGHNAQIIAFQRPKNSGSQTLMLYIMGDVPMASPVKEEWAGGMGGIVHGVAQYRNYASAIGYSFRYFVTAMHAHDDIKILSINGIAPTPENIRNGTYPFTINVYAITTNQSENKSTDKLIQWLLSEQGQAFIELCGIVGIK